MQEEFSSPQPNEDLRRIDLAAAEWLVKHDRGLSAAEQDEYFQWLAADPRHGEWFARHRSTWGELNSLVQWRPEHATEPNPDLLAPARPRRRRARLVWFCSGVLAAAASVAVFLQVANRRPAPASAPVAEATTTVSGCERRVLEDGSVVVLNRGAIVTVDYTAALRQVHLVKGEALFTVAKNALRPFIVQAASVKVRAVGTAFNVRLDAAAVEVLVTHGLVQVAAAKPEAGGGEAAPAMTIPLLKAGQSVVVPLDQTETAPVVATVSADELKQRLAWEPKFLDFNSKRLAEVVAQFNRGDGPRLEIGDPSLADMPIVMSFRADNVEGFVRLLELTAPVRAERDGNTIVLRRAP